MICWSVALAWAETGDDDHVLADSIYHSTSNPDNRHFAEDDDSGAFVRYRGGLSKPEQEDNRIIGGTVAEGTEYGFMAFVYYNQDGLSDLSRPSCSATIIDRQWLLTAANCLTAHNIYGPEVIYFKNGMECPLYYTMENLSFISLFKLLAKIPNMACFFKKKSLKQSVQIFWNTLK